MANGFLKCVYQLCLSVGHLTAGKIEFWIQFDELIHNCVPKCVTIISESGWANWEVRYLLAIYWTVFLLPELSASNTLTWSKSFGTSSAPIEWLYWKSFIYQLADIPAIATGACYHSASVISVDSWTLFERLNHYDWNEKFIQWIQWMANGWSNDQKLKFSCRKWGIRWSTSVIIE